MLLHVLEVGTNWSLFHTIFSRYLVQPTTVKEIVYLSTKKGSFGDSLENNYLPPEQKAAHLLPITKFGFLKLREPLPHHNPLYVKCYLIFSWPCRNWGSRNRCTNGDFLGAVRHKTLSFISDPGTLCLLPEPPKFWKINFYLTR